MNKKIMSTIFALALFGAHAAVLGETITNLKLYAQAQRSKKEEQEKNKQKEQQLLEEQKQQEIIKKNLQEESSKSVVNKQEQAKKHLSKIKTFLKEQLDNGMPKAQALQVLKKEFDGGRLTLDVAQQLVDEFELNELTFKEKVSAGIRVALPVLKLISVANVVKESCSLASIVPGLVKSLFSQKSLLEKLKEVGSFGLNANGVAFKALSLASLVL